MKLPISIRARAVGMIEAGLTYHRVAEDLGVSLRSVKYWCAKVKAGKSLEDAPRSGRPSSISPIAKMVISKSLGKRRQTTRKLARNLTSRGYPIGRESVRQHLIRNCGATSFSISTQPALTNGMKKARVKFAREKLTWTIDDWKRVVWSDESFMQLYATPNPRCDRVWAKKKKDVNAAPTVKFPTKIMVCGAFGHMGVSQLHIVEEGQTVNYEYYINKILDKYYVPAMRRNRATGSILERRIINKPSQLIFMQDGATAHTARSTTHYLQDRGIRFWRKHEWPSHSPDLNPIENLWNILKERVADLTPATTRRALIKNVKKAWANLDPNILENLVASMPNRMKSVIRHKGKHISY